MFSVHLVGCGTISRKETVSNTIVMHNHVSEARVSAENLLREVNSQLVLQEPQYIRAFTRMYHVAAHAASLHARTDEVAQALFYYQQMEYFARLLEDDTFLKERLATMRKN